MPTPTPSRQPDSDSPSEKASAKRSRKRAAPNTKFNPYASWLGIELHEGIVDHYRLLGLSFGEGDQDRIEAAADEQMNKVRVHQTGPRGELTQIILNQIAEAKLCLLNAESKQAYDEQMRSQREAAAQPADIHSFPATDIAAPPVQQSSPSANSSTPTPGAYPETTRFVEARKRFPWELLLLFGFLLVAAIVSILMVVFLRGIQ